MDGALTTALDMAKRGYRVHPCHKIMPDGLCSCGKANGEPKNHKAGKHPLLPQWQDAASNDGNQIKAWAKQYDNPNWGLLLGAELAVIDQDGPEARVLLEQMVTEHGMMPTCWIVKSPRAEGDGRHYYYKQRTPPVDKVVLKKKLELRTANHYVLLPGSNHIDGVYEWEKAPDTCLLSELPEWFAAAMKPKPKEKAQAAPPETGINTVALAKLGSWVPDLFPDAKRGAGGVYRITSEQLGRDLEEDLSISPEGIKDFGVHDMGDAKEGKRTALDLVMQYGQMDYPTAIAWLGDKLGFDSITINDFYAYHADSKYVFLPVGAFWYRGGVDGQLPGVTVKNAKGEDVTIPASTWLDKHRRAQCITWVPGKPQLIHGELFSEDGEWVQKRGATTINNYRPPNIVVGDATKAAPWVELVQTIYPLDFHHILAFFAFCRRHPGVKINHMLFLGGAPGIGKDSIIVPLERAVGPWNFKAISPKTIAEEKFDPHRQAVVMLITEFRDMGDITRTAFYEATKDILASPPYSLRVNQKHVKHYYIPNVCKVIGTSNYLEDTLYLPENDRRHYIAWSPIKKSTKTKGQWIEWHNWMDEEGAAHVTTYLDQYDLTAFLPKAEPLKTEAFMQIVTASLLPDEVELDQVLRAFKGAGVTIDMVIDEAKRQKFYGLAEFFGVRENRRKHQARMGKADYEVLHNTDAADKMWVVNGVRRLVYIPQNLKAVTAYKLVRALTKSDGKGAESEKLPF